MRNTRQFFDEHKEAVLILESSWNISILQENYDFSRIIKESSEKLYHCEQLYLSTLRIPTIYRQLNQDGMLLVDEIWMEMNQRTFDESEVRMKIDKYTQRQKKLLNTIEAMNIWKGNNISSLPNKLEIAYREFEEEADIR